VRDALSLFGFGGQDAGDGLFIDFFFGNLREAAAELLIADGLPGIQKGQERLDLRWRQGVDDLMKPVQVTHDFLFVSGRYVFSISNGKQNPRLLCFAQTAEVSESLDPNSSVVVQMGSCHATLNRGH
jgi:hypothetical protein